MFWPTCLPIVLAKLRPSVQLTALFVCFLLFALLVRGFFPFSPNAPSSFNAFVFDSADQQIYVAYFVAI